MAAVSLSPARFPILFPALSPTLCSYPPAPMPTSFFLFLLSPPKRFVFLLNESNCKMAPRWI